MKFCYIILSLTASIINRYWVLQNATLNGKEYRYFAYGMHDQMETPPTYSYACKTATFVRYDSSVPKQEHYNFSTKFYIIDLQVNQTLFIIINLKMFYNLFSFNHFMEMDYHLVHRIIVHHFLPEESGWL